MIGNAIAGLGSLILFMVVSLLIVKPSLETIISVIAATVVMAIALAVLGVLLGWLHGKRTAKFGPLHAYSYTSGILTRTVTRLNTPMFSKFSVKGKETTTVDLTKVRYISWEPHSSTLNDAGTVVFWDKNPRLEMDIVGFLPTERTAKELLREDLNDFFKLVPSEVISFLRGQDSKGYLVSMLNWDTKKMKPHHQPPPAKGVSVKDGKVSQVVQ